MPLSNASRSVVQQVLSAKCAKCHGRGPCVKWTCEEDVSRPQECAKCQGRGPSVKEKKCQEAAECAKFQGWGPSVMEKKKKLPRRRKKQTVKKKKIIFVKGGNSRVEAGPSSRPSQDSRTSQVRGRVKFKLHSSNTLTQHTGCE